MFSIFFGIIFFYIIYYVGVVIIGVPMLAGEYILKLLRNLFIGSPKNPHVDPKLAKIAKYIYDERVYFSRSVQREFRLSPIRESYIHYQLKELGIIDTNDCFVPKSARELRTILYKAQNNPNYFTDILECDIENITQWLANCMMRANAMEQKFISQTINKCDSMEWIRFLSHQKNWLSPKSKEGIELENRIAEFENKLVLDPLDLSSNSNADQTFFRLRDALNSTENVKLWNGTNKELVRSIEDTYCGTLVNSKIKSFSLTGIPEGLYFYPDFVLNITNSNYGPYCFNCINYNEITRVEKRVISLTEENASFLDKNVVIAERKRWAEPSSFHMDRYENPLQTYYKLFQINIPCLDIRILVSDERRADEIVQAFETMRKIFDPKPMKKIATL